MASLNLSTNGASIKSSYQGVVNRELPKSDSPTFALWALFTVQAPLINAFQAGSASESVLKVETKGGEHWPFPIHPCLVVVIMLTDHRDQMASLPT